MGFNSGKVPVTSGSGKNKKSGNEINNQLTERYKEQYCFNTNLSGNKLLGSLLSKSINLKNEGN